MLAVIVVSTLVGLAVTALCLHGFSGSGDRAKNEAAKGVIEEANDKASNA